MRELRNHPTVASPDVVYILSPFIRRHGPLDFPFVASSCRCLFNLPSNQPFPRFYRFSAFPQRTRVNSTERQLDSDNSLDVHDDARVNLLNPDSRYQSI
jgi:hypothetical protein